MSVLSSRRSLPAALPGILLVLLSLGASAGAGTLPDPTLLLRCGTLIDAVSDAPSHDIGVRIEGDRIQTVGPFEPDDEATTVDLSDRTCLPGLIDAHAHVLIETDDYQVDHMRRSAGTDHVGFPVRQGVRELTRLVEVGMTPMEALRAGTIRNAEMLGRAEELGSIEAGKLADIVAVPGDPLEDLSLLEDVGFVMLGGEIVKGRQR